MLGPKLKKSPIPCRVLTASATAIAAEYAGKMAMDHVIGTLDAPPRGAKKVQVPAKKCEPPK
jgi:hypothetical protein